jgi:hypothetical protein
MDTRIPLKIRPPHTIRGRITDMNKLFWIIGVFPLLFGGMAVLAATPNLLNYQGRLTTPAGTPVADGKYTISFRIYDDSTAGDMYWQEIKSVQTTNGLFSVHLGDSNLLDQSTFSIPNLYLALKVGADAEMKPRTRFASVPYATLVGTVDGANGGTIQGDLSATHQISAGSSDGSGGYFQSFNTGAGDQHGVIGRYTASGPNNGSGVYGYSRSDDNHGIGGEFEGGWIGVFGWVNATQLSTSVHGGIEGVASTAVPELNAVLYGVAGYASGARSNTGVLGSASGVSSSFSGKNYGLFGDAEGTGTTAANYGVWAQAKAGLNNIGIVAEGSTFAGQFIGDVYVSGSVSKPGGSFKIDHPLDPANKYLQHSFVESPDMMNIYNGIVTLDADGTATVTMPEWFDALNRDFRYQLTAVGAPGPNLYVSQKVNNNQFAIAGGSAGLEVSWQVTGVRHDAWAEAHRIQVEVPKEGENVGTYLHPELFGKPESMGETYGMTKTAEEAAQQSATDREKMVARRATDAPHK